MKRARSLSKLNHRRVQMDLNEHILFFVERQNSLILERDQYNQYQDVAPSLISARGEIQVKRTPSMHKHGRQKFKQSIDFKSPKPDNETFTNHLTKRSEKLEILTSEYCDIMVLLRLSNTSKFNHDDRVQEQSQLKDYGYS